jgi:Xaa-Pro aminopeptidase
MAVVGEPSDEQRRHHDAIREIVRRSIEEALVPGAPFARVIEQLAGFYRDCGYGEEQFRSYVEPPYAHLCHGIGLASSEPPFVRAGGDETLAPGAVLTCEAYLSVDGMTYGSEEDVLVTEDGCRVLSEVDGGLAVLAG